MRINKKLLLALLLMLCSSILLCPTAAFADGEVTASVTAFDASAKKIIITVSENIEGSVGSVYLYDTESGNEISASASLLELNKIKVVYSKELSELTEYAVVFKNDIYGVSGYTLSSRYVYFTTDSSSEPDETTVYDYDTRSTTASGYQNNWASAYCDEEHGKAMQVTAYAVTGNMDNDLGNISYYSADKWAVSFDVKIVKSPASFGILLFGENNTAPTSFGFGKSRAMFRDNMWWSFNQLGTDIDRWFADSIFADYKVGEWVNYKAVYDVNSNSFSIYENGVFKLTVPCSTQFNKLTKIRVSMRNQNINPTSGETLIWFDNLTLEKYPTVGKVEKIRISDLSGNTVAAPQTTKRDIDKIDINFLCEVNKSTLTSNTMKLMYGAEVVDYTIIDTHNDKTCTIKPVQLPSDGDVVMLSISGAKDKKNNTLADYSTSVTVSDDETGFIAAETELTAADGSAAVLASGSEVYVKTSFANKSDENREVIIFVAGYTEENSMETLGCKKLTIPANCVMSVDHVRNSVKLTLPNDGCVAYVMGCVNVVEDGVLVPMTEAPVLVQE